MIRSRITFIENSQSSSQHLKSGEHCFHRFLLFHSESLILLDEGKSFCLLDLSISFVSHLERIVDGLRSFFVGDLLILVVRDGVEKNGSGFMMIQKLFLLGLRHLISGNDLPFSILRMFIALNNNIPEIFIKAKKKNFLSYPSNSQISHHQRWEVLNYNDCLYFQRNLPCEFFTRPGSTEHC